MNYICAAYVNHVSKEFSVTARPANHSSLKDMDTVEAVRGFQRINLAEDLDKNRAEDAKAVAIAFYLGAGYSKVFRAAI